MVAHLVRVAGGRMLRWLLLLLLLLRLLLLLLLLLLVLLLLLRLLLVVLVLLRMMLLLLLGNKGCGLLRETLAWLADVRWKVGKSTTAGISCRVAKDGIGSESRLRRRKVGVERVGIHGFRRRVKRPAELRVEELELRLSIGPLTCHGWGCHVRAVGRTGKGKQRIELPIFVAL